MRSPSVINALIPSYPPPLQQPSSFFNLCFCLDTLSGSVPLFCLALEMFLKVLPVGYRHSPCLPYSTLLFLFLFKFCLRDKFGDLRKPFRPSQWSGFRFFFFFLVKVECTVFVLLQLCDSCWNSTQCTCWSSCLFKLYRQLASKQQTFITALPLSLVLSLSVDQYLTSTPWRGSITPCRYKLPSHPGQSAANNHTSSCLVRVC